MVALGWLALVLVHAGALVLPVGLGRTLLHVCRMPVTHDAYAFAIGCYILWGASYVGLQLAQFACENDGRALVRATGWWVTRGLQGVALGVLWLGAAPIMLGMLTKLMLVVPWAEETVAAGAVDAGAGARATLHLTHDWMFGLLELKLWHRLALLGALGPFGNGWRERLERVQNDGVRNLNMRFVLREVVGPITLTLGVWLIVPYVGAQGVLKAVRANEEATAYALRRAHLVSAVLAAAYYAAQRVRDGLKRLHDDIRDEVYLVNRRLVSFDEGAAATTGTHVHVD